MSTKDKIFSHFRKDNNLDVDAYDECDIYLEDDFIEPAPVYKEYRRIPHEKGTMRITKDSGNIYYIKGTCVTEDFFMKYRDKKLQLELTRW